MENIFLHNHFHLTKQQNIFNNFSSTEHKNFEGNNFDLFFICIFRKRKKFHNCLDFQKSESLQR